MVHVLEAARRASRCLPLAALLLLGACSTAEGPELADREFSGDDVTGHELVADTTINLSFDDEGELGARAGCNRLFAHATWGDHVLHTTQAGSTAMGCEAELHDQDEWLMDFLTSNPTIELSSQTLRLASNNTTVELHEVLDLPLEDTTWEVTSLLEENLAASLPEGTSASLTITGEEMSLEAGCNSGSGLVEVGDDTLDIDHLALTRMTCSEEAMDLEQHVMSTLEGSVDYEINGPRLTLQHADIGLELRAEE